MHSDRTDAANQGGNVLGLVMAAGFSRRFGDADKRSARLPDGRTLLERTLAQLQPVFTDPNGSCRLAVAIRTDDNPDELGIPRHLPLLPAANAARGLGASIADAVQQISHSAHWQGIDTVAIMLGDMPSIGTETLCALTAEADRNRIVQPRYRKQPGHPVLFGRAFWNQMRGLTGDQGARAIIVANKDALTIIDVDDVGVLLDIDTPQQLQDIGG